MAAGNEDDSTFGGEIDACEGGGEGGGGDGEGGGDCVELPDDGDDCGAEAIY